MICFNKPIRDNQTCKKKSQISYFPILFYFWYIIFECLPCTKMQKAFVLQFVLGSHTIWLDYRVDVDKTMLRNFKSSRKHAYTIRYS